MYWTSGRKFLLMHSTSKPIPYWPVATTTSHSSTTKYLTYVGY